MSEPTEAQRHYENQFRQAAHRLVQLLEADAPPLIVCEELGALVSRASLAYGELLHSLIGRHMRQAQLTADNFCLECERRFERVKWETVCPDCRDELEREIPGPEAN